MKFKRAVKVAIEQRLHLGGRRSTSVPESIRVWLGHGAGEPSQQWGGFQATLVAPCPSSEAAHASFPQPHAAWANLWLRSARLACFTRAAATESPIKWTTCPLDPTPMRTDEGGPYQRCDARLLPCRISVSRSVP
jgi:hypothetical protein